MKLCAHCGHRIERTQMLVGGVLIGYEWLHKTPHPEHICRCTTPTPELPKEHINGGLTTYQGYLPKEGES